MFQPPNPVLPAREGIIPGQTITIEGSKNIYGVAQQYNVSMRDLIVLNNIQPPFALHNGQKLVLPAPPGTQPAMNGGESTLAGQPIAEVPSSEATPQGPAGATEVQTEELPPLPAGQAAPQTQYTNTPKPASSSARPAAEALTTPSPPQSVQSTAGVTNEEVASINPSEATPPEDAPPMSFVWPVQGPVLSGFGPKGEGLNNDGVNIGAPKGAPVVAAAPGIVVYAGNEMKGFGNLVLIRHQGGWVTAYAHLDRVLVSKNAVVAQGDELGTVGKTGNVDKPQLHFETRYEGKPVDPAGVVKNNG
jgi:murein DD-endopeptidase MepM/ murein hydrolase activator NlpD